MSSSQPVDPNRLHQKLSQAVFWCRSLLSVLTSHPDVIELRGLLWLLADDRLDGKLKFFPMERIF